MFLAAVCSGRRVAVSSSLVGRLSHSHFVTSRDDVVRISRTPPCVAAASHQFNHITQAGVGIWDISMACPSRFFFVSFRKTNNQKHNLYILLLFTYSNGKTNSRLY